MELKLPLLLILALVVILLYGVFSGTLVGKTYTDKYPEGKIIVINEPDESIKIQQIGNPVQGTYEYAVEIPITVRFSNDSTKEFHAIAMISFKETDAKANVQIADKADSEKFDLLPGKELSMTLKGTNIFSLEPLVQKAETDGSFTLKEKGSVIIQDATKPTFIVKLRNLYKPIFNKRCEGFTDCIFTTPDCTGSFDLECSQRKVSVDLVNYEICQETGFESDCKATQLDIKDSPFCKMEFEVQVNRIDCTTKEANINVQLLFKGDQSDLTKYKMEAGEKVGISFWDFDSECVKKTQKLRDLFLLCKDAHLGGPYYFNGHIA